ncbi:hypothetical protein [Burkholderia pseudomallei]|uniref:hypothetical protein n=1 Tax=Burkholderia pseudomallei TaxID=28450 RepID=UPI00235F4DA3|nr:hypothetical protein [Burkholderia pseudomallei]
MWYASLTPSSCVRNHSRFRFYDARIMPDIARVMSDAQRSQFFVATYDWLVEIDGRLTGVHPHA